MNRKSVSKWQLVQMSFEIEQKVAKAGKDFS